MPREPICLENFGLGNLIDDANEAIGEMERDVIQRPNITGARSVTIKLTMKPVLEGNKGETRNFPSFNYDVSPVRKPAVKGMELRGYVDHKSHGGESRIIVNTGDPLGQDGPEQMNLADIPNKEKK